MYTYLFYYQLHCAVHPKASPNVYYCDGHNTQLAPHSHYKQQPWNEPNLWKFCHLLATNYNLNVLQLSPYQREKKCRCCWKVGFVNGFFH